MTLGKKAIMLRGSIEHEQIIYESSNRRMKQLMPGSKRVTRVAGAGCHSVGVAAAEE